MPGASGLFNGNCGAAAAACSICPAGPLVRSGTCLTDPNWVEVVMGRLFCVQAALDDDQCTLCNSDCKKPPLEAFFILNTAQQHGGRCGALPIALAWGQGKYRPDQLAADGPSLCRHPPTQRSPEMTHTCCKDKLEKAIQELREHFHVHMNCTVYYIEGRLMGYLRPS